MMEARRAAARRLDRGQPVAGDLVLSGRDLRFEPADGADARAREVRELVDIRVLRRGWAPVAGLPLLPTVLVVEMRSGERLRFAVKDRGAWMRDLRAAYDDTARR